VHQARAVPGNPEQGGPVTGELALNLGFILSRVYPEPGEGKEREGPSPERGSLATGELALSRSLSRAPKEREGQALRAV